MNEERYRDATETWETIVFPKEVFERSPLEASLEDIFHHFGIASLSEVKPDSSVKKRILSKVLNKENEDADFLFIRKSDSPWKKSAFPGVEYKILNKDNHRNTITLLIRMEAGAVFPGHSHGSAEDCLLISGDLHIAGTVLKAGDFHRANAGSLHKKFSTSAGAEFLIVSGTSDFAESEKYFSKI